VVFRKDAKTDTFQRQISALRQQLGSEEEAIAPVSRPVSYPSEPVSAPVAPEGRFGMPLAPTFDRADAPPAFEAPGYDARTSVVAHDTAWNGDLQTSGALHIHGKVTGTVSARSDIFVAEDAEVDATVTAENLAVAGLVRGTIRCSGRLEVLPQGRVNGDVFAQVLIVHEGATMNGQFSMTAPEESGVSPLRRRVASAGA
jgi:cytoskeletal protein CcmA (bactofilin family)